jgi:UDP:flavonoid glycosyltransferase YjiC (YdhE family)
MPWEGHFRPLVPLAHALDARGHDVVFAAASEWEPRARDEGFELLGAGLSRDEGRELLAPQWDAVLALPPERRRPLAFATIFGRTHAPVKLPQLLELARTWGADAIVYDSCDLAAPIAAASLGLPAVNHSFGTMVPLAALEAAREHVDPLWRGEGLDPDPHAGAFRGLYVDLAPPSFSWEQPHGKVVRMRPVPDTAEPAPPWLNELEPPLVYVTMGTVLNQPEHFRPLLDGLDGHGSALVTVGRDVDPAELGPLPARVRVERYVPQAHILPRAAAVVSHGGSGTTLGALAQGVPLVLVPQAADQFDNAARAEAAGAAVVLRPGEVSAESVREALGRVLGEPTFAESARGIAAEIREMATVEEAAATVEDHVAHG